MLKKISEKAALWKKKTAEDNRQNQFYQSYYLVKYDNNVIKIFFSDETGNLVQLEETGDYLSNAVSGRSETVSRRN